MPMEAEDLAEMDAMIATARKKEVNFAVCMGKKPEDMIFLMHRLKDGEVLSRRAKKLGDTAKIAYGVASLKGTKLNLKCAEDPPPNKARSMKMFLKENGHPFKVYLLNMAGEVIDTDGDEDGDDDDDDALSAAAPGEAQDGEEPAANREEAAPPDPLAEQWAARVGPLGELFAEAMAKNPPNRTQLEAAWAMANEKADALDFKAALTIADRMEPSLKGVVEHQAGAEADPLKAKYEAALGRMEALRERAIAAAPANIGQLEAVWAAMTGKADAGDYKMALAAAAKLLPALQAAATVDPNAAPWVKMEAELSPLYQAAMKQNPPEASKLQAAWAMATEKADALDFAAAVKIGERLKPLLEAAAKAADAAGKETGVVAFQRSRILWVGARQRMLDEARALAEAVAFQGADDEDADDIEAAGKEILAEVERIDERLQDVLDEITNAEPGRARDKLKQRAAGIVNEYQSMLSSGIFATIDDNPIRPVAVAGPARAALGVIARTLA